MTTLKKAISLPEDVFLRGEALAKRLGVKRSRLYALALEEYLTRHNEDRVTAALNEVYATQDSKIDVVLAGMQAMSLEKEDFE